MAGYERKSGFEFPTGWAMGCGTSGDSQSTKVQRIKRVTFHLPERVQFSKKDQLSTEEGADMLDTYLRLEKEIWQEERAPPAPALSQGMVRLARASAALEEANINIAEEDEELMIPGSVPQIQEKKGEKEDEGIRKMIHELGLNRKPELSAEHEEFIANLNRRALVETKTNWLLRRRNEAQEEVERLTDRVQNLQALYENQDAILKNLEGEGRSEDSKELDRLRGYRDVLYSGEMSWREASRMVEAGAALARAAAGAWDQAKDTLDEEVRWKLGVETRRGIQEAVLCIDAAQTTLHGVQFPYCTPRELTTALQALEYLFTDMQIPERYNHASHLYNNFHKRAAALHLWIKKVMEETIHKDVLEVDKRFTELATKVTNQRVNLIRQLAGLGVVKYYHREGTLQNLKNSYNQKQTSTTSESLFTISNR